jgi:GWxTD domain-containing protein
MKPLKIFSILKSTFFILLFLGNFAFLSAQPNSIYCELQVKSLGSIQQVEVAFEVARLANSNKPTAMALRCEIISNGKIIEKKALPITQQNTEKINSTFYYNFIIERVTDPNAMLKVYVTDLAAEQEIVKTERLSVQNAAVAFGIKNVSDPLNNSFIKQGDKMILKATENKKIYLVRFTHNFVPAAPPMGNNMSGGDRGLQVDSVIAVNTNEAFSLNTEGLYFAQEDTSTVRGMGFRVVSEDFPKYKQVENLAHSMIYIATNNEINSFLSSPNKKAALDNFWINTGGGVDIAKELIKEYYQRITYANKSFTNYKEGWKTDRGIIYVVFGRPDEVASVQNGQQWVYFMGKKRKRVTFEFKKKPNMFSGFHYVLFRSPRYKKVYYEAVEMWRKGEVVLP